MAITKDDFEKIWASTSPLTPYTFNDSQYKEGWNFVGATPPSRQMWDAFMQNADEKLKYLYQHEDVPVGHEYFTFNPNVPEGSLPLFGGEYSRETYSALWNWVQQQTGYLKTESEWQTLSTANNGNVPYYSDGDGSTTFRVPSLKCWIKAANGTVMEVGSYLEAGLPNIRGLTNPTFSNVQVGFSSGSEALTYGEALSAIPTVTSTGSGAISGYGKYLKFDASRSNSIYGNSSTVQPPSVVGMWLVKAYGIIVDLGEINEQEYIDDRFNASKQYTDDKIAPIGTTYFGTWTASASSTAVAEMTQRIENIPLGKYLAILKTPVMSNATHLFGVDPNGSSSGFNIIGGTPQSIFGLGSQQTGNFIIDVTNTTNRIVINSSSSASVTFSSLERGGLTLVRISG